MANSKHALIATAVTLGGSAAVGFGALTGFVPPGLAGIAPIVLSFAAVTIATTETRRAKMPRPVWYHMTAACAFIAGVGLGFAAMTWGSVVAMEVAPDRVLATLDKLEQRTAQNETLKP